MKNRYLGPIELDGLASRQAIEALFEADNLAPALGSFTISKLRVAGNPFKRIGYWALGKEGEFTAHGITRQLTQYNLTAQANPKGHQESSYSDRVELTGSFECAEAGSLQLPENHYADFSLAALQVIWGGPRSSEWDVRLQLPLWHGKQE